MCGAPQQLFESITGDETGKPIGKILPPEDSFLLFAVVRALKK
jgi:hypothetical protein